MLQCTDGVGCGSITSVRMRRRYVRMTPDRVGLAAAPHQIRTRFSGARKSLSLGLTLKALYQASTFRTTPLTRYFTGAWGFETICWRIESSVDLWRQL